MLSKPHSARIKVPATIATQNPDNAARPPFCDTEHLSTTDDIKDAISSYKNMGCQEYLWAWEGKFVDESAAERFYTSDEEFFKKNNPGRDIFFTLYLPRIWREPKTRAEKTYNMIISAAHTAKDYNLHTPPIFEVAVPISSNSERMMHVVREYNETAAKAAESTRRGEHPKLVSIIPIIDDVRTLVTSDSAITEFIARYQNEFRCRIEHIRPFISRRDLAVSEGFVSSTILTKLALCESYNIERKTGVKMLPIVGAGTSAFFGGLTPHSIHRFMTEYSGTRTATITPSFRYDYDQKDARTAIRKLNEQLPKSRINMMDPKTARDCNDITRIFAHHYKQTIRKVTPTLLKMSANIPERRERQGADGLPDMTLYAQSRQEDTRADKQPQTLRGVKLTASLYSLGIPPELIGTGRGILDTIRQKKAGTLKKTFPTLSEQLYEAGAYLNKENLAILCSTDNSWNEIKRDVELIEDYTGKKLASTTMREILHRNHTSNILHLWLAKQDVHKDINEAARLRRFLG